MLSEASHQVLLKRIYGLEEVLFKEQQSGCLVLDHLLLLNGMLLLILNIQVA